MVTSTALNTVRDVVDSTIKLQVYNLMASLRRIVTVKMDKEGHKCVMGILKVIGISMWFRTT